MKPIQLLFSCRTNWEVRETGIADRSHEVAGVRLLRVKAAHKPSLCAHDGKMAFSFVRVSSGFCSSFSSSSSSITTTNSCLQPHSKEPVFTSTLDHLSFVSARCQAGQLTLHVQSKEPRTLVAGDAFVIPPNMVPSTTPYDSVVCVKHQHVFIFIIVLLVLSPAMNLIA